jgi:ankyrin repeat protein
VSQSLQGGTQTTIPGPYGTALNAASMYGPTEVVKLLLESGADVNIQGEKVLELR